MKTSSLTSRAMKSLAALLAFTAVTTITQPAKAATAPLNIYPQMGFYADNTNAGYTFLTMSCNITAPTGIYYLYFPIPGNTGSYYTILGTGSNTSPTRSVSFGLVVDIPKTTPDMTGVQMYIQNRTTGAGWWTAPFSFQIKSHFPPPAAFNWTGSWKESIMDISSNTSSRTYTFTTSGASTNIAMKAAPISASNFKSWTQSATVTASGTGGTHLSGTGTGTYVDNSGKTTTYRFNITVDDLSTSSAKVVCTITSVSKPSGAFAAPIISTNSSISDTVTKM